MIAMDGWPTRATDFFGELVLRLSFNRDRRHSTCLGTLRRRREDSLQFFKEEKVDGAVYNLYLKKVRYHTPSDIDDPDDKHSHLQWRTIEVKVLKSGTPRRLVEAVAMPSGEIDSSYVSVFLQTFRSFSSPNEILKLLLERYQSVAEDQSLKQQAKEMHRKTIRTVISVWLDAYPEDFKEVPLFTSLRSLIRFAETHMEGSDLGHRARHRIDKFQREEDSSPQSIEVEDVQFNFSLLDEVNLMVDDHSGLSRPVDFTNIPENVFAEQLTYMDSELFKKVVPHHCLGSVWSRRDKKRIDAPTVYATVNQFNAVSYRVIATVLKRPDLRRTERAKVIEKWINVAQELRFLKNFSSLKAIIAGLQSNPVYRLRKVWAEVDKESRFLFDELSEIFSEENNQLTARELLMKEGTAKFAEMGDGMNTLSRRDRRKSQGGTALRGKFEYPTVQGTIPYLGTFLTDLTMIDTAIPDVNDEGQVNFEKKRKEFEILAQIKLLQSAAQLYVIRADPAFFEWFHSVRTYDDKESYELSCDIEAVTPTTPKEVRGHRKKSSDICRSFSMRSSLSSPLLGFFTPRRPISMDSLQVPSPDTSSSLGSYGGYSEPSTPEVSTPTMSGKASLRHSISMGSLRSMDSTISMSPWLSPETCVVKVTMETADSHETNFYKSVMLTNSDHTKNVIRNILIKFDIKGDPDDYLIYQVLPDKEFQIPEKGNVFYAINNAVPEVKIVVRKKSELERIKAKQQRKSRLK